MKYWHYPLFVLLAFAPAAFGADGRYAADAGASTGSAARGPVGTTGSAPVRPGFADRTRGAPIAAPARPLPPAPDARQAGGGGSRERYVSRYDRGDGAGYDRGGRGYDGRDRGYDGGYGRGQDRGYDGGYDRGDDGRYGRGDRGYEDGDRYRRRHYDREDHYRERRHHEDDDEED